MASKRVFTEEDFSCPVCCAIFKEPVLLSCGHSVCRVCIRQYWRIKGSQECPLCRKRCARKPPINLALRNLSETFLEVRGDPETLCEVHGERLKLYCVDEARPVCVVCRDSVTHQHHRFRPVEEAAAQLKDVLKSALNTVTVTLKNLQDAQFNCHRAVDHIQQQAHHIRIQIKEEFRKLHQFLQEENAAILTALGAEEQQKKQSLEGKIKTMSKEILSLSNTIRDIRKEFESDDISFLKNFEKTLERAKCAQMDPKMASVEVMDVAKYLGNLQFRVWEKMQNVIKYTPVILDPNTAHPQLILSGDLTSVRDSDDHEDENMKCRQQVPETLERFNRCLCVLGSESFSLGVHSWDIEVGNNSFWMVGVTTESIHRKEYNVFPSGAWGVGYDNKRLCARSPLETYIPLPEAAKPLVVRVYLNMNAGQLWFSDPLSGAIMHRFTHRFTEKVFPFFHSLCSLSPLKILPFQLNVEIRRHH